MFALWAVWQSNLRLVKDESELGVTVHHDHSLRKALNRGKDFKEGEQADFIEDHGFLMQARYAPPHSRRRTAAAPPPPCILPHRI